MKRSVVNIKDLEHWLPVFRGKFGNRLAKLGLHLFAIDRVNEVYSHSCDYKGADFSERLLKDLGVDYLIGNAERLRQLPEGAFITISNHPYGGLDGIMLIDLMVGIRPDYKLMVNQVLSLIETMKENFISVKPRGNKKDSDITVGVMGTRETIRQLQEDHPVGFFPAGAVSDFHLGNLSVRDREWQESILKLIQLAKVPVVPIRFFDKNSLLFYFLGLINWRIRLIRLPYEIFNKKKQQPRIGIGKTISVEELSRFTDFKSMGFFLRKSVYDMPKPTSFISKISIDYLPGKS
jgi:putative hemolysin